MATTIEDLYDGALDDEEIGNFVQSHIDAAKKAVDKITKKKPQISTNKSAYLEAKKKWEGELREAERKAQYWNDVKAEVEKITTPADERTDDNSGSEGGKDSEGEVRTRDEGSDEQKSSSEGSAVVGLREQETDSDPTLVNVIRTLYQKGKDYASKIFNMKFFDFATTPDFMKHLGMTGSKFTIRYGVIARHFGKDGSHDFTQSEWEQIPHAIEHPFAVTQLKNKEKGFRIYTALKTEKGEYVVVGVDVKNAGRDMEVNAIATMFGRRSNANLPENEEVIYKSKEITPEQEALLSRPNSDQYPAERESSDGKVKDISDSVQENGDKSSENEGEAPLSAKIEAASADVNTDPTEAQKEAGNYKKGHVQVGSFDIKVQSGQRTDDNSGSEGGKDSEGEVRNRDEGSDEQESSSEESSVGEQREQETDIEQGEGANEVYKSSLKTDNQGNPLNADGTLKLEQVESVDELTDEDFLNPTRNVALPKLPENVDNVIGANGKTVIIKKNIFEKNKKRHKDLSASQGREILTEALYITNLYGQNQKITRPYNWILIHNAKKHSSVVLEVNHQKDNVEIVNWHYLDDVSLKRKKRQAIEEGGLILTLESAAANTQNDLSSDGKGNNISDSVQENGDKSSKTKQSKSTAEEKPFNAVIEMLRKKFPDASMEALTAADRLLREQALPGERQKAIEAVAKALGLKVEWRDTMEKENGTFNPKTRTITIARDSEHALVNTFGHEVTHAVRNLSEADYKNLKDAVRRLYSSEKEYNEAVQAYGDEYTGLDFDALEEELIADNIGFMIGGRNDMTQELASRMNHRVLWAIHDAMNKVRNALAKVLHIDSKKNGLLEVLDSARATIRETMANAQRIAKEKGQGLSNESDSTKQSLRTQDSAIRDAFVERMRLSGMDVITDETGQRVLDLANGKVRLMGSRTNKKMKEIADVLSEHELSEQQKTVVDVYSGKTDNLQLEVSRNDGNRRIVIRQGNDNKTGTKHSVYRHYGTTEGVITAEDILLIPEVLNRGERKSIKRGNTQLYEYVLRNVNGAEYTVLTEINNRGKETFADFYSNKKVSSTARKTRSSEAQARLDETLSVAKIEEISKIANKSGEKLREQRVYHGSGAEFDHFDHIRFFRTANGEAYGFTVGGKIYIDPRIATSETPIHEYAHLWATALKSANAKEWQNVVGLMKGTKVWDEVKALYPELKSDDEIADEVLATYSGRRGAERLREEQRRIAKGNGSVFEKAEAISALESVKQALKRFWKGIADFLHIHYTSAEEVADRVMKDLLDGVDPRTFGDVEKGIRFQTSEELNNRFGGRWLDEQTNDDGRHTTQVKSTINSYKKFGDWVKRDSNGRDVDVLDASSGLGLGTAWMRDNGFKVDDVEPFPSDSREAPTFSSYDEIDKKYDYIISNAVLNVIPDDWRANVLHQMADKLKDGGKLVINVRGAESISKQGKEGETRITLDSPSEILVLRPNGSIKAYQKGFTKSELKEWCEKELGEGYSVEIANNKNAGGSYDTAVVVTKNNESGTVGVASEAGHPSWSAQALPNSSSKLNNNSTVAKDSEGKIYYK